MDPENDLHRISDLKKIWRGGYFQGSPDDPVSSREYGVVSLISSKYAVLKAIVEPNINMESRVLEIGPGRGAWTKVFGKAREIYVVDILSAEHNSFWKYVGDENRERIRYIETADTGLTECPDNYFDFIFSFGAFCHMPPATQIGYYESMFRKARSGALSVIMFADFDKHNLCLRELPRLRTMGLTWKGVVLAVRFYALVLFARLRGQPLMLDKNAIKDRPGRFFHMSIEETATALRSIGWEVISPDIGLSLRDPIVLFRKP